MATAAAAAPFSYQPDRCWGLSARLLGAIQSQDVRMCAEIFERFGADVDQEFKISSVTRPAVCHATQRGSYEIVQILIKNNCAINRQDSNGLSALHIAIHMKHDQIALLLLENRASVTAIDNQGNTPLHIAARRGNLNIAKELISRGADIHRRNNDGYAALGYACLYTDRNVELVELLLRHGADAQETDKHGASVLYNTLQNPKIHYGTVKLLIERGAKADLISNDLNAPIHLLIQNSCAQKWKTLDLLLKSGCDVNILTRSGQTPLHLAILMNDIASVRILLLANANPNTTDVLGISPLLHAIKFSRTPGMLSMIQLLLSAGARMPVERFNELILPGWTDEERETLKAQLANPMKLSEIARKGIAQRFAPHTRDWIKTYGKSEMPQSLIAFVNFKSDKI